MIKIFLIYFAKWLDDTDTYNFINNDALDFIAVTIEKNRLGELLPILSKVINHCIHDTDAHFSATLHKIWEQFTSPSATAKKPQLYPNKKSSDNNGIYNH